MMTQVYALHKRDPNFPLSIIEKIEVFIGKQHPVRASITIV